MLGPVRGRDKEAGVHINSPFHMMDICLAVGYAKHAARHQEMPTSAVNEDGIASPTPLPPNPLGEPHTIWQGRTPHHGPLFSSQHLCTHRREYCTKGRPSTVLASAANPSMTQSFGKIQGSNTCHQSECPAQIFVVLPGRHLSARGAGFGLKKKPVQQALGSKTTAENGGNPMWLF